MSNKKSDRIAKESYIKHLISKGYSNASIIKQPADIEATLNGEKYFFEIKMTRKRDKYFGAATLTEWKQAIEDSEHFRFVVAIQNEDDSIEKFIEFKPDDFLKYSSIPPFKVNFNIDFNKHIDESADTKVTKDTIIQMDEFYHKIKKVK